MSGAKRPRPPAVDAATRDVRPAQHARADEWSESAAAARDAARRDMLLYLDPVSARDRGYKDDSPFMDPEFHLDRGVLLMAKASAFERAHDELLLQAGATVDSVAHALSERLAVVVAGLQLMAAATGNCEAAVAACDSAAKALGVDRALRKRARRQFASKPVATATLAALRVVQQLPPRRHLGLWEPKETICTRVLNIIAPCFGDEDPPGSSKVAATKREIVRQLVRHFDIDARDASTLLADACSMRCCPVFAQALLDAGADVRARCARRRTCLHACRRADTAQLLIAEGADVDALDNCSRSPLFHAVFYMRGMTEVLLEAGANPDLPLDGGRTALTEALSLATDYSDPTEAFTLLRYGATLDVYCNDWKQTLRDCLLRYPCAYGTISAETAEAAKAGDCFDFQRDERHLRFYTSDSDTDDATERVLVVSLVVEAAAWHRRRHMLLAIRGRRH